MHLLVPQEAELDDLSLIGLSVHGDVAKKLLHYLKQKLPSSCLSDLLCSHTFSKHYLRRGGESLEDEELLGEDQNKDSRQVYTFSNSNHEVKAAVVISGCSHVIKFLPNHFQGSAINHDVPPPFDH